MRAPAIDAETFATCFPSGCSIAATFDPQLARRIGTALADDARRHGAQCVLGPTVCIQRHPLGGRNFESLSEDPLLTGRLASQVIQGLQSQGVAATIKHFVANEQETARTTVNETISERALREIYLKPFEIAVQEAQPWALMTAYNLVNGVHCDSHRWLLQDVLRGEWGWQGLVMSDWGGTNSLSDALVAGLDLEMPGPPRIRKPSSVKEAVAKGDVPESVIDERAVSVVKWALKLKAAQEVGETGVIDQPNTESTESDHIALVREAEAKVMVLLKNENHILPLDKEGVRGKKIALIGYAKDALAHGGGSAAVRSRRAVTPWEALHADLGDVANVTYAKGAHRDRLLPTLHKTDTGNGTLTALNGGSGFTRYLYEHQSQALLDTQDGFPQSAYSPLGSQESLWKTLELVSDFTPSETGTHYLACSGLGPTKVYINDDVIFEQPGNCADPMGSLFLAAPEPEIKQFFEAGKTYRVRITSFPPINIGLEILEGRSGVRLGFSLESQHDADLRSEAVDAARDADYAIVFSGHSPQWETEGRDQDSFDLPNQQNQLISAIAAANENTIVVNSTGVAVSMHWLAEVKAVVQAWFPGQECGASIADVLTGAVNPGGHLPVSFPRQLQDCPAYSLFPGKTINGRLESEYSEGVFVGYRHFDRVDDRQVNFSFGHGLSYTTFAFDVVEIRLAAQKDLFDVSVQISNTGSVRGTALAQIYVGRTSHTPAHPFKTLVGFQKVDLEVGETTTTMIQVRARDFAFFSEGAQQWTIEAGEYTFYLGSSATSIEDTRVIELPTLEYPLAYNPTI